MKKTALLIMLFLFLAAFGACEKEPEARSTVFAFIKKLYSDREIKLDEYCDLDELVRQSDSSVYVYNSTISISENIDRFARLFEPEGKIRRLWTSKRIVVGEAEVLRDTAYVEVTFIDDDSGLYSYNRMGLKRTDEGWLIFAFKLL